MEHVSELYEATIAWVFNTLVNPTLYSLGLMSWSDRAYDGTAFLVAGVLQVVATAAICIPLERVNPVQRIDLQANVRTDVIYTLINKLGLMPLFAFAVLWLALRPLEGEARMLGFTPWSLEDFWPALAAMPALSLAFYLVIIDCGEYWRHRFQHRLQWWWQLHALHHAQRDMTFWSDNRNHILDTLLAAFWIALIALLIGIPPEHFPLVIFALEFIESLSHANLRWNFGPLKYVIVSPQFHRVHHSIEPNPNGAQQSANFSVVFSFWDKLFGTADFSDTYPPTGIRDQLEGRNYGTGFWETQWLGFSRLKQHFSRR